jgi:hypothetical protein
MTAQADSFSLVIKNDFLPSKASGLLLNGDQITEIAIERVTEIGNSQYKVEFSHQQAKSNSLISFNFISEDGASHVTGFQPVAAARNTETLKAALPACTEYSPPESVYRNGSVITRLVELREERLEIRQKELEQILEQKLIDKISKIESTFGLTPAAPISSKDKIRGLANRLARVRGMLISYKMQQKN